MIAPVAHTFEWDTTGTRIAGIRFRMDDGTDVLISARTAVCSPDETDDDEDEGCPHGDPDCLGGEEDNHWACDRPYRKEG